MIAFFEQCQETNKAAGILKKIAKDKKQPKEKKMAHPPAARSCELSYHQHCSCKYRNYHQSNRCNHDDCQSDYHHQDNRRRDRPQCNNKDSKSSKSYNKKDDCKRNHFKKKSDKAMHNDQFFLSSTINLSERKSQSCSRSPSRSHSQSCSCSSNRSYNNHHVDQDNCKPSVAPKHGYLYSKEDND